MERVSERQKFGKIWQNLAKVGKSSQSITKNDLEGDRHIAYGPLKYAWFVGLTRGPAKFAKNIACVCVGGNHI